MPVGPIELETDEAVHWGDSSLAEMCFAIMLRYPESDSSFCLH